VTPRISQAAAWPQHLSHADAVGDLYRQHAVGLVRVALLLVGDQASAEDVVQEAFLGLYRNWPALNDHSRLVGYLRVSVVNGSRGVLRARKRAWLSPVRHDPPVWSAEAAAMATEDRRAVLAAVARLPRRQREVLVLRYFAELADTEIASVLGVSRGTVVSTASRALGVLGRQVKEEL
jgi:RNA polymerase sigma-70 factor (sigma-E family)